MIKETKKVLQSSLCDYDLILDTENYCPSRYHLDDISEEYCRPPINCEACWKQALDNIESFEVTIHKKIPEYKEEVNEEEYNIIWEK